MSVIVFHPCFKGSSGLITSNNWHRGGKIDIMDITDWLGKIVFSTQYCLQMVSQILLILTNSKWLSHPKLLSDLGWSDFSNHIPPLGLMLYVWYANICETTDRCWWYNNEISFLCRIFFKFLVIFYAVTEEMCDEVESLVFDLFANLGATGVTYKKQNWVKHLFCWLLFSQLL